MITSYYTTSEATKFIIDESRKSFPRETGGILVGKFLDKKAMISHAVGPGPNAQQSPNRFKRDGEFSQTELDKYVKLSTGAVDYIGEWHSHPQYSAPSLVDLKSMTWVAANPTYEVKNPILLLCIKVKRRWIITCYLYSNHQLLLLPNE